MTLRRGWAVVAASLAVAGLISWAVAAGGGDSGKHDSAATKSPASSLGDSSISLPRIEPRRPGYNAAANDIINPSTKTGGTLRLLTGSDCNTWDPGRAALGWCANMQRLITRTLVGYTKVDGTDFKLGADLATALGRHNSSYTQWTYTLKRGLRFANGAPITPRDVEYGVERSHAGMRQDGAPTITTTSNSITFHLSQPNADFNYLMALPASAPVPNGKHPVASGPFEISSDEPNKSVVFARNSNWRQSTDTIRHPLVDKVVLTVDTDESDIDNRLRTGSADARADAGVQPAFQSQILTDPKLEANADDPVLAATRYMAVVPSVIPNIHCRRAIFYAWDKAAAVRAFGGLTADVIATSMTPPGIEGYDQTVNPYPSGPDGTGDVAKAKQELKVCGKPNGFTTRIVYVTPSESGPRMFAAEQKALGRVGIKIVPQAIEGSYQVATPAELKTLRVGLVEETGEAGVPTAYAFYEPFAGYHSKLPTGLTYGPLDDPTVQRVLRDAPRGRASETDWNTLDQAVMADGVYLPFLWEKTLYYRNPRMTNVTCDDALASGIYDFVNVGVR
jgi:peptide/nickel transport system substrate-binding protein